MVEGLRAIPNDRAQNFIASINKRIQDDLNEAAKVIIANHMMQIRTELTQKVDSIIADLSINLVSSDASFNPTVVIKMPGTSEGPTTNITLNPRI